MGSVVFGFFSRQPESFVALLGFRRQGGSLPGRPGPRCGDLPVGFHPPASDLLRRLRLELVRGPGSRGIGTMHDGGV